ncbi:ABC transporter ATP-binding protein [Streptococcus mutans]|nr:ABC transporter ATP-binding protein [Streptococcus mutans]
MLFINDLSFAYTRSKILKSISLTIDNKDQIIALLGPNGAGKTTLLNVIANYYQKHTGHITREDYKVFMLPDMAYIPQDMTVNSCLRDFQELYQYFNRERAEQMLNYLNLDFIKKISDYSKGMKEQLHLVFALAQDVDYYLLDEPLAAVDPLTRDILIDLIKRYRRPKSVIIISTHLVQDMEDLFDEIVMINNGQVILYKTTEELTREYSGMDLDSIYKEVNRHVNAR